MICSREDLNVGSENERREDVKDQKQSLEGCGSAGKLEKGGVERYG